MPEDQPHNSSRGRKYFDIVRPGNVPENPTTRPILRTGGEAGPDPMLAMQGQEPAGAPEVPQDATDVFVSEASQSSEDELGPAEQTAPSPEDAQAADTDLAQNKPSAPPVPDVAAESESGLTIGDSEVPVISNEQPQSYPEVSTAPAVPAFESHVAEPEQHADHLLPEHAVDEIALTPPSTKPKRSVGRKIVVVVLALLVLGAVALDVLLLMQYLKLK